MKLFIKKFIFLLLFLFIILASINLLIPITSDFIIYSNKIIKKIEREITDKKSNPSEKINFKNYDWSKKHFEEFIKLKVKYNDYILWRRLAYKGETINISKDGFRLNNKEKLDVDLNNSKTWFFGGSAMWGSGSKDNYTIPSYYEQISNKSSINFGETGYTSSQELNLLLKYINLGSPEYILFYDGVNDIYTKCRKENNYFSSSIEQRIKKYEYKYFKNWYHFETVDLLKTNKDYFNNFVNYFADNKEFFDCHNNKKKAELIVQNLIDNWLAAKNISERKGAKFIAILQPISFYSNSITEHLNIDLDVKKQFDVIYPLIKKEAEKYNLEFYDYTGILDQNEYYFWDFVHLSPEGNKIIAEKIFNLIK
jgi:lysophospholipase L1-like esterase